MAEGTRNDILTYKDASGVSHVVPVDIVTAHEDDRSAEVTAFPVEKGADINDHIIQQPDLLSIEVAQTQTPMPSAAHPGSAFTAPKGFTTKSVKLDVRKSEFKPGGLLLLTTAAGDAIGGALTSLGLQEPKSDEVSVNVFQSGSPVDRIGELHDALIRIKESGFFCTCVFRGKIYPQFIVKRVRLTSAKNEVGLGRFALELQSIHTVETSVANLPDPAALRLKPEVKKVKPPKPVGDPKPAASGGVGESLLSKGTGLGIPSS